MEKTYAGFIYGPPCRRGICNSYMDLMMYNDARKPIWLLHISQCLQVSGPNLHKYFFASNDGVVMVITWCDHMVTIVMT